MLLVSELLMPMTQLASMALWVSSLSMNAIAIALDAPYHKSVFALRLIGETRSIV